MDPIWYNTFPWNVYAALWNQQQNQQQQFVDPQYPGVDTNNPNLQDDSQLQIPPTYESTAYFDTSIQSLHTSASHQNEMQSDPRDLTNIEPRRSTTLEPDSVFVKIEESKPASHRSQTKPYRREYSFELPQLGQDPLLWKHVIGSRGRNLHHFEKRFNCIIKLHKGRQNATLLVRQISSREDANIVADQFDKHVSQVKEYVKNQYVKNQRIASLPSPSTSRAVSRKNLVHKERLTNMLRDLEDVLCHIRREVDEI